MQIEQRMTPWSGVIIDDQELALLLANRSKLYVNTYTIMQFYIILHSKQHTLHRTEEKNTRW